MNSFWRIDGIDCVKSQVKLSNTSSGLQKSFFLVKLVKALINGDKLIAICEDAIWTIDIETGNRKRDNDCSTLTTLDPQSGEVYIPEFLRKKSP